MEMEELKPCPFCGSDASLAVSKELGVSVRCTNLECKCQTPNQYDDLGLFGKWPDNTAVNEVVKRWNKRQI